MKKLTSFMVLLLISGSAIAATPSVDRRSNTNQWMAASRAVVVAPKIAISGSQAAIKEEQVEAMIPVIKNNREDEKRACISNNIGVGNTFVWASKYSNTNDYASMVEDTEEPENNVCFVRVELKSSDSKVNVSDIRPVYYEMGRAITCGTWADSGKLKDRILDAKKTARTWGTVAGAVGGAAVGVGAMELFGNKLIGGAVEGQKGMDDAERFRSQMAVLQKDEKTRRQHDMLMKDLKDLKTLCEDKMWDGVSADEIPKACSSYQLTALPL